MPVSIASSPKKVEQILGDLRMLPLLPATAQQAMTLANNSSASITQFARLVEKDVTLASSILKLANSPVFSWGRTIESVEQACIRLGLRECQNLMMATSMRGLYHQANPVTKAQCSVLWQHCFLTACLARRLNKELDFDYQGGEFAAGLLHDLGRILVAVTMPEHFNTADPMDFHEDETVVDRERNILETDHCALGTAYAEQNCLPHSAVAAIRFHHDLKSARDHRGVIGLVAAADHMANHLQRGEDASNYDPATSNGFQYLSGGWPPEKTEAFKRKVPGLLAETARQVVSDTTPAKSEPAQPARPTTAAPLKGDQTPSIWGKVSNWFGG
jgi:HD-like signal output (HDOD) protein